MKKTIISLLLAISLIFASTFSLSACNNKNVATLDFKNAYRLGVTAGVRYLQNNDVKPTNEIVRNIADSSLERPSAIVNDIDVLNSYVKMFEGYLANNTQEVATTPDATTELGMTYGNYTVDENTIKMSFSVPSLDGSSEIFTVYYTEALDNGGYVKADDDDEQEVKVTLNGVAVVGDEIFALIGERECEIKNDEQECELMFIISKDSKNYIKLEYSSESEIDEQENELEFSVYKNDALVSKTSVEFESEDGEKELELKFKGANFSTVVYKLKYEVSNLNDTIIVNYYANNNNGTINITSGNDVYIYSYSNGFTETISK